jgi:arylsulfatase A-like enzyme
MDKNMKISRIPLLLGIVVLASPVRAEEPKRAPNILIIVADDLGWRDVGYHDSEIKTPTIDRLAKEGVRLERHYVYPTCSPTRAGILTGRNASRFGIHAPIAGRSEAALPKDTPTLARTLAQRGYETALFGKWHLGLKPEVGPRQYGFQRSYGYLHGQIDQYTHLYKNGDRTWHRDDVLIEEKGHATDLIADESVKFLQAERKKPFFLWVAFSVPHHPVQEEEKWLAPYQDLKDASRRQYAASVAHMDAAIGRIVETLEKSGQVKNTLILFTSDNGGQKDYASKVEYEGKHGPYPTLGDNRPLRGWKGQLYEGGIRVPAFVSWPGHLKSRVVKETVSNLDWLPTLARVAGAEAKGEGRDVTPLLTGEDKAVPAMPLYWNTGNNRGVLVGDWKLIEPVKKKDAIELYDLASDPTEAKNVAGDNPKKVEELRKVLTEQSKLDRP